MTYHNHKLQGGLTVMAVAVAAALSASPAAAMEFDTGNPELKVRWDNTVKYSTMYRLLGQNSDPLDASLVPGGFGYADRNFNKGFVSQRLDWISELDVSGPSAGMRISTAAWYDNVYHRSNDQPAPGPLSYAPPAPNANARAVPVSVAYNEFTSDTRKAMGGDGRLMDAFVYGKTAVADMPLTVRLGQHALVFGETLMSGGNGIAKAQGAIDIIKAASVPGANVKEFILPTPQISASLQLNSTVSLGAYYQFKWVKNSFFATGSYLAPQSIWGKGAESFFPANYFYPTSAAVLRESDMNAKDSGQWGAQMRLKPNWIDAEFGLYAANYHEKMNGTYLKLVASGLADPPDPKAFLPVSFVGGAPGTFQNYYAQNIRTVGVSASGVIGADNVAIEASVRDREPVQGGSSVVAAVLPFQSFDNDKNPGYGLARTGHITLSDIHLFAPSKIWDGASVATQLDWHTVFSVKASKNLTDPLGYDPDTTKSAANLSVAFAPEYYQVMDGVDIKVPIFISHNLYGRSRIYGGWLDHGGEFDVGVDATYLGTWKAGLHYHVFYGHSGIDKRFDQLQRDRDYISFNIQRTF